MAGAASARLSLCAAMTLTRALPTTTPSATLAMAWTCAAVETPKPTQIGKAVCFLISATAEARLAASSERSPVTPSRET